MLRLELLAGMVVMAGVAIVPLVSAILIIYIRASHNQYNKE